MPLPAPTVPDLTPENWIDLDQLGNRNLTTWINYPGIAHGDVVYPNWRGCSVAGDAEDIADSGLIVTNPGPQGMLMDIDNARMHRLDQGWVFYSYQVPDSADPGRPGEESQRLFFYVGKRDLPRTGPALGVVQFQASHELRIILDWMKHVATATVVTPPYRAMAVGDRVTLKVQTFFGPDDPWDTISKSRTLDAADLGQPLSWQLDKFDLEIVEDGHVLASYLIDYARPTRTTESPVQRLEVVRAFAGPLLPAPVIPELVDDSLDPGAFPEGIAVQVEPWPGARAGDVLLLYLAAEQHDTQVLALPLDLSSLDSGWLVFRLEQAWLAAHDGLSLHLFWQYARPDACGSGEALDVLVRKPLKLPPPIVEDATPETPVEEGVPRGYLYADKYIASNIHVRIPDDAEYGPQDQPQVHWDGHGSTGQVIITRPTVGDPRRFQVPSRAIPANMGKRLNVFYRVTPTPDRPVDSGHYDLQIRPMTAGWPAIQLREPVQSQPLSLADVPASGARFQLRNWSFMAEGQAVEIVAEGLSPGEQAMNHVLRDRQLVSADEYATGELWATLPRAFLQGLKTGSRFSVKVRTSFDDGQSWVPFRDVSIQLVA